MARYDRHRKDRSWLHEQYIYIAIWILIFFLPIVNEIIAETRGMDFSWSRVTRSWIRTTPFLLMFVLHNSFVIPNLLSRPKLKYYIASVVVMIAILSTYTHSIHEKNRPPVDRPRPEMSQPPRPGRPPLPFLLPILMSSLMFGVNLAISLMFRYYREQDERKMLETIMLQDELKYLKTQINPHFFMNMLNNIHAMIEIDSEKAQDMIIELSKLMRYLLHEGENQMTSVADEVRFISSYVSLMRLRYPEDKVEIRLHLPESPSGKDKLPPLLFIAFIENAFKHGVSYMKKSVIEITLTESPGAISFHCLNTKPSAEAAVKQQGGVGLENVKRRLSLLYGNSDMLAITENHDYYTVKLNIPLQ